MTRFLRYTIAVSALTLILAFCLTGGEARGQSAGATGTPTATSATPVASPTVTQSVPSAQDLLTEMHTAVAAKNSVHTTLRMRVEAPSTARVVETLQGDISNRPQLAHMVGRIRTTQFNTQPAKTTTQREELIIVKNRVATKTGKKAWSCTTTNQITQVGGGITPTTTTSIDTLGPETVDTIPVWHVREVDTVDSSGQSVPLTVDYYISQADFTLVRATVAVSVSDSGGTLNMQIAEDNTKYGEKVQAALPAACGAKSSGAGALAYQLSSPLDEPAALARSLEKAAPALAHDVHSNRAEQRRKGHLS